MTSLVSKSQQPQLLDKETACLFLKLGIFSRSHPLFSEFFQQLKFLNFTSKNSCFLH